MLAEEGQPPVVVKAKETDTLSFIIKITNFYRVHRVYIVDSLGKPYGVITLTDLLQEILNELQ